MNQCRSILLIISKSRESGQPNIPLSVWPLCGLCFVSSSGLLLNDAIMLHLSTFSGVCILCRTICRLGLSVFFFPHSPVIKLWDLKWEDNAAEVSVKEAWSTCSCNLLVFWTRSRAISYMPLPTDCFTYVLVSQVAPHYNGDLRLHGQSPMVPCSVSTPGSVVSQKRFLKRKIVISKRGYRFSTKSLRWTLQLSYWCLSEALYSNPICPDSSSIIGSAGSWGKSGRAGLHCTAPRLL